MESTGKDPSVRKLADLLRVNRNTACYMAMRIRRARTKERDLLAAIYERMTGRNGTRTKTAKSNT